MKNIAGSMALFGVSNARLSINRLPDSRQSPIPLSGMHLRAADVKPANLDIF